MSKTAAMFPGQGSQFVGMARGLFETDEKVRQKYQTAAEVLGFDIAEISFSGPGDVLLRTKHTQPAIFVHSCVVYDSAVARGFAPDFCVGHSLGEYTALYAAGVLTFAEGLTAVGRRAEFMQQACDRNPGTMAVVISLDYQTVREVCDSVAGIVQPANHNSPEQIAISGEIAAVEEASRLLMGKGARRVLLLPVGGAFHSPLMEPVPQQLAEVLARLEFRSAQIPVLPNVTARPTTDPAELRELLVKQITAPVLWYPTLQWLAENGVEQFVELGPKKVLCGLVKKSIKGATFFAMEGPESIAAVLADAPA